MSLNYYWERTERATVEKKVKSMGLTNNVTFTGYLDKQQVYSAYHAADLMLFPSKTETQGLTAVESIMCGTPVVGLNEMGVKNVIDNNESGILTKECVSEYASAAIELLKNENLRKKMSKKAMILGQKYSYLTTNKKLEELYQHTLANHQIQ